MNFDKNIAYGIFSILLWSSTVTLVRSITGKINAINAGVITFSISGLFCIFILLFFKDFSSVFNHSFQYISICGSLFVIYMIALFVAIERAKNNQQTMELGLVNYLWPSLTVILSLFIINRNVKLLIIPGILLSVFGIFIVITQHSSFSWKSFVTNINSNPVAYLSALIAAISWAIYSNLTNLLANPNSESAVFIFIPLTGLVFIMISQISKKYKQPVSLNIKTLLELLFFCIATILAYLFWDISMRKTNVTFVAVLSYFTPFFSTLLIGVYLREKIRMKLLLGCFIIIFGSLISWFSIYE